jgi:predicted MPP superfamily phosphohydrolase
MTAEIRTTAPPVQAGWFHRRFTRRHFLRALLATGTSGGLALAYARFVELHWLEIVRRDLPVRGLPADLVGCSLVQLSDLHVGPLVDDDYVRGVFRRVRDLQPDFVVVTGDWISYRGTQQLEQLDRLLVDLPMGKRATMGILGNHDYGTNWQMRSVADRLSAIATSHGVIMLRNAARRVGGLQFVGLDDFWGPAYGPAEVLAAHARDDATVALCHNPDVADEPVWEGFRGWILSGHTHGGQCRPPFLPPPLLPVRNRRYTSGAFELGSGRYMYINRAVGHLLPARFNVRPEVTVFRLTADANHEPGRG